MSVKLFAVAASLAGTGLLFAQCESSAPVRELLKKPEFRRKAVDTEADRDMRTAAFKKALSEHPDDYFLLRRELQSFEDPDEALAWARGQSRRHPDTLVYQVIEAQALMGRNTPEAIKRLEALNAAHPDNPRIYLELADGFDYGKFRDKKRVQAELDGYRKLCPDSIDGSFLNETSQNGSPQQIASVAAALRKHLDAATGEPDRNAWESLWSLEFKSHPLAGHPAVRKQIAADLARLEALPASDSSSKPDEVAWLIFLRGGYQSVGDQAKVEKINNEILANHPKAGEARRIVLQRFRKEHPMPPPGDEEKTIAWRRANLALAREQLEKAPGDSETLNDIFNDLRELPETKPEELTGAIDQFLAAYKKKPDFWQVPPFEWRIAESYIKFKIRLDQVPALVEDSYRATLEREKGFLTDDRNDEVRRDTTDYYQTDKARILLDYYALTQDAPKAREVIAGLDIHDPAKQKSTVLTLKAKAAEIEGHQADALMLYRAALLARSAAPQGKDKLSEDLNRLWKEMGGTPEGYVLLTEKPQGAAEATDSRWRNPRTRPPFTLTDLQGKSWTLAHLEGKTLLINIWATWCGPCQTEHPEFQKLYEKMKDRPDVSVFSFNVDDDIGKVAPYMEEHKYTFPVMPAKDVVDAVVPELAIPRNWPVDAKGKLQWEQIGFGVDSKWQEMMLAKLDELVKNRN